MPRYIVKLIDPADNSEWFMEWSTVVDAPVTWGLTRDEFTERYRLTYGASAMAEFADRMARVDTTGTSALDTTLDEIIAGNRAGDNEKELSYADIVARYCGGRRTL